jgi:hypothetical protein
MMSVRISRALLVAIASPVTAFYAKLSCALVVVAAVNPKPFRRSALGWRPVATGLPT